MFTIKLRDSSLIINVIPDTCFITFGRVRYTGAVLQLPKERNPHSCHSCKNLGTLNLIERMPSFMAVEIAGLS